MVSETTGISQELVRNADRSSGPTPDPPNQKLRERGPAICVRVSLPRDTDAPDKRSSPQVCVQIRSWHRHSGAQTGDDG